MDLTDTAQDAARLMVTDRRLRAQFLQAMTEDNRLHIDEALRILDLVRNDIDPQRIVQARRVSSDACLDTKGARGGCRVAASLQCGR